MQKPHWLKRCFLCYKMRRSASSFHEKRGYTPYCMKGSPFLQFWPVFWTKSLFLPKKRLEEWASRMKKQKMFLNRFFSHIFSGAETPIKLNAFLSVI